MLEKPDHQKRRLFVEATNNPDIIHRLLFFAKYIGVELGYSVHILKNEKMEFQTADCASMYLESFVIVPEIKRTYTLKLIALLRAVPIFISSLKKRNLLEYVFEDIPIGQIIYDTYLGNYTKPTVYSLDPRLLITSARVILRVLAAKKMFSQNEIHALLLSHRVGMECGTLQAVAQTKMIEVYSFSGDQSIAFSRTVGENFYPNSPTTTDIEFLSQINQEVIYREFESTKKAHLSYSIIGDTELAFKGKIYSTANAFLSAMNRDSKGRKIIFIMAHVPNDFPNAFGLNPSFCDYHEWLLHCLEIASLNHSVFWIIKEHPANRAYGFDSEYIDKLKVKFDSEHILFLSSDEDFSSHSIGVIADAIVTCNGSSGFEFPALYNVPSVYYSNSFYSMFNFGISVNSIAELDFILANVQSIDLEALMDFEKARLAYTFIYSVSRIPLRISPSVRLSLSSEARGISEVKYNLEYASNQNPNLDIVTRDLISRFKSNGFYALRNWKAMEIE